MAAQTLSGASRVAPAWHWWVGCIGPSAALARGPVSSRHSYPQLPAGAGGWPEGLQAWALMFLSLTVPTVDRPCLKKDADRADWIYVPNDPVPSSKNSNTGSFSVHANVLFAKGSVLHTWPSAFMRKPCCCKS